MHVPFFSIHPQRWSAQTPSDSDTATTAFPDTAATATDTAIVDQVPKGRTGRAIFNVS